MMQIEYNKIIIFHRQENLYQTKKFVIRNTL